MFSDSVYIRKYLKVMDDFVRICGTGLPTEMAAALYFPSTWTNPDHLAVLENKSFSRHSSALVEGLAAVIFSTRLHSGPLVSGLVQASIEHRFFSTPLHTTGQGPEEEQYGN